MRPIRNRVLRAAAIAALLLTALVSQATPALGWDGGNRRHISISPDDGGGVLFVVTSPDDGGGILFLLTSPDDGGGILRLLSSPDDGGSVLNP